jgi:cytochrome b pre-mRNA-processing protein 3
MPRCCSAVCAAGDSEKQLAQDVFDTFFEDMDGSLREMGVGDIVVPKRIAAMGEALYGRAQAYGEGLDSDDPAVLADAVARNLIGSDDPDAADAAEAAALANYLRAVEHVLAEQEPSALLAGEITWPDAGQ